jgi:hypothetical protein
MPGPSARYVSGAVEGDVDEAVARRLVTHVNAAVAAIHVRYGKDQVLGRLGSYNKAARLSPWLVLLDLDDDAECAPTYIRECLPQRAPGMCLRVVVRKIEAWLLADRLRIARFLAIPMGVVPLQPEMLTDPKAALVQLAGRSRRRDIREDMVPRPGSGRRVGPAYSSRLIEFARDEQRGWRPRQAARNADSLARCLAALQRVVDRRRRAR